MKTVLVSAVALIDVDGRVLLAQRPEGKSMAGLWEFPGGKIEPGETVEACIAREIQEEINLQVEVGDRLMLIEHDYPKFKVSLHVHWCSVLAGEAKPLECAEILWVNPGELGQYQFPEANQAIIEAIQES